MVYRIVLVDFPRVGWVVAFVYLLCGALRLARFNCIAAAGTAGQSRTRTSAAFRFPPPPG